MPSRPRKYYQVYRRLEDGTFVIAHTGFTVSRDKANVLRRTLNIMNNVPHGVYSTEDGEFPETLPADADVKMEALTNYNYARWA